MSEADLSYIFIPGNVPSSKNSRIWTGTRSIKSGLCQKYISQNGWTFALNRNKFIAMLAHKNRPYLIGFHFVRDSNRRFDFCNAVQIIQDLMVKYGWIEDDNCSVMFPLPLQINGLFYTVDKNNPGVYISVI